MPRISARGKRRQLVAHRNRWPPSKSRLQRLVAEAIVDAYGDSEQRLAFLSLLQDNLALPFQTDVLGMLVTVEKIDLNAADEIVATYRRGGHKQAIHVLDLPLPTPSPAGAEWIEAYRLWARGE